MEDRRVEKRKPAALFIRFSIDENEEVKYGSFSHDLSTEGIGLLSPCLLKENSRVEMSIDVPDNPDMTLAAGSVRWISGQPAKDDLGNTVYKAGVEITDIDRLDREYLREYLRKHG